MSADIDAFRDAVLADARQQAQRSIDAAEQEAGDRLAEARQHAEKRIADARREGREAAEREMRHRRVDARRRARALVLGEQRRAVERLRERTLETLRARRDTGAYEQLMARLEALAREQLGDDAEIEPAPEAGGLVARSDARRVDYRLPVLVDRLIDELGAELEDLWK